MHLKAIMAIDPEDTQRTLNAYLGGTLSLAEAADRIAAMLAPSARLSFTVEIPLEAAATAEAKRLAELQRAVIRKGTLPGALPPA